MKRGFILLLGLIAVLAASPVLIEAYQEESFDISPGTEDTFTIIELPFSTDTACYCQLASGGLNALSRLWLELEGNVLHPQWRHAASIHLSGFSFSYLVPLEAGEYTLKLRICWNNNEDYRTRCEDAYLQALLFLPDEQNAVAEQPPDNGLKPIAPSAVVASGPYVSVPGATQLIDASGRTIEDAITDNRVQLSTLPPGTYFARSGERTVVKIVKVQ